MLCLFNKRLSTKWSPRTFMLGYSGDSIPNSYLCSTYVPRFSGLNNWGQMKLNSLLLITLARPSSPAFSYDLFSRPISSLNKRQVEGSSPSRPTIFPFEIFHLRKFHAGPFDYKSEGRRHNSPQQSNSNKWGQIKLFYSRILFSSQTYLPVIASQNNILGEYPKPPYVIDMP